MEVLTLQFIGKITSTTYETVRGKSQISGQNSEKFKMNIGINQGNSQTPLLFVVVMDKFIKNKGKKKNNNRLQKYGSNKSGQPNIRRGCKDYLVNKVRRPSKK